MLDFIKKSKWTWTIGGLEDFRSKFKTLFYLLFFLLFFLFNSNPPSKEKDIIKINTYICGGLIFFPPQSSLSSKKGCL